MPSPPPAPPTLRGGSGLSSNPDSLAAVAQACDFARQSLSDAPCHLVFAFFSPHHTDHAESIAHAIRERLNPECLVGMSTQAVIGGELELERSPGLSILALSLPGVTLHPFTLDHLDPADTSPESLDRFRTTLACGPDSRATFFFADPFVPMVKLLPALNRARPRTSGPLIGAIASGGRIAGDNAILLNDRVLRAGAVGLTISGPVHIDPIVSQGCRPIGPTAVVTKAKGNVIFELGGKPTAEAMRDAILSLGERAKEVLNDGLHIGRVVNEYKERFGRDDFLIRNVVGLDPKSGGMAVNDIVKVGMTIRFHVRDRATASEDLAMLLDGEKLHGRPAACLLLTCNGRGQKLFNAPNHDASAILRAFDPPRAGEELARGGTAIEPASLSATHSALALPLAGCFAAGEIGPVGDAGESFLHGHTACAALFRQHPG